MKILDKIDTKIGDQVPVRTRFAKVSTTRRFIEEPQACHTYWELSYGFQVQCTITGPREHSRDMLDNARMLIAREVFGEITDDLIELKRELLEEDTFRPQGDPAMKIVNRLIRKVSGERGVQSGDGETQ